MNDKKRRVIHVISKMIIILLVGSVIFNGLIIGIVALHHNNQLEEEVQYLEMPGRLYSINGYAMHIYETGDADAEQTLVFMHGTMATDSVIALRPLFDELKDSYRIVYIDRKGNGFSDDCNQSRDVATMLAETRELLAVAEIEGPYVLVPYYSAGLEALYWYQQYPEEVEAIVGLDMTYPAQFAEYDEAWDTSGVMKAYNWFCKIGGHRFVSAVYPENAYQLYSDKEMKKRDALVSSSAYTTAMYNEDFMKYQNVQTIGLDYFPTELPVLQLLSNKAIDPYLSTDADMMAQIQAIEEQDPTADVAAAYNAKFLEYYQGFDNVTCVEIAGPTKMYEYCPKTLAEEIVRFLKGL